MNCANHNDAAAAAYCRTCGKPLCSACSRDVRGVIYCENCLAARLEGTAPPPTAYQQVMDQGLGMKVPPTPGPSPNPGLAGVLAAMFPFGVGAVYTSQYAKGLAHLLIFSSLIWGVSSGVGGLEPVFGIAIAFFYVYQIVDAVRTARALQLGQPAPDPFGLARTFGAGEKTDIAKVPAGAIVLIGLGLLFLLHTLGAMEFSPGRFWPVFLIAIGVWLFARRWGLISSPLGTCNCARCKAQGLMGPAVLVTLGVLFMLDSFDVAHFGRRTWPVLLVVIGLVKILQSNSSAAGHLQPAAAPGTPGAQAAIPGPSQPPSNEVRNV
jgi:hypothetical protein